MALHKPEDGWCWMHVTDGDGTEFVAVSDIETWWSHWTGTPGGRQSQAVRCLMHEAGECAWCEGAHVRRARYVFAVRRTRDDQVGLIELGRVQYNTLAVWSASGRFPGTRFLARKAWKARNAPIELTYRGREEVPAEALHSLVEYVSQLGRENLRLFNVPKVTPSEPAEPGRSRPPQRP